MRVSQINYVAVGLFVLGMTTIAAGSLIALKGSTGPSDPYHVMFGNVGGLKYGTQVRYEGFPVGQVERIVPETGESGMRFRVDLHLTRGWNIPEDSIARIAAANLLAAKTIDIEAGVSRASLAPGATINAAATSDMFEVMARAAGEISDISSQGLKPLLRDLGAMIAGLSPTVAGDVPALVRSLSHTVNVLEQNTPAIASRLSSFTERLNVSMDSVDRLLTPENAAAVHRILADSEAAAANFRAIGGDLQGALTRVDGILDHADSLVANADGAVRDNREKIEQSLADARYVLRATAQNVDAILHNLDGTSRNMNEFARLIRQNPGLLLNGKPREEAAPASLSERRRAGSTPGSTVGATQ